MFIGIQPVGHRLLGRAILFLLFCSVLLAQPQPLGVGSVFRVVVYAAKDAAGAGFAKKGAPGMLRIHGPTISFPYLDPEGESMRAVEINDISEIKKDSIGWFEIGMKDGEKYKFCNLAEWNKCAEPVEPVIDALTAALIAATPNEAPPRADDAARRPPTPHHFAAIPPPDGSPLTLEQTMRFLQEQLGALSSVKYASYLHYLKISEPDTMQVNSEEVTNVRASAVSCQIDDHIRWAEEDKVYADRDESTPLTAVDNVAVMTPNQYMRTKLFTTLDQYTRTKDLDEMAKIVTFWTDPPLSYVVVRLRNGQKSVFPMYDEAMAHKIADALGHAIEFCRN